MDFTLSDNACILYFSCKVKQMKTKQLPYFLKRAEPGVVLPVFVMLFSLKSALILLPFRTVDRHKSGITNTNYWLLKQNKYRINIYISLLSYMKKMISRHLKHSKHESGFKDLIRTDQFFDTLHIVLTTYSPQNTLKVDLKSAIIHSTAIAKYQQTDGKWSSFSRSSSVSVWANIKISTHIILIFADFCVVLCRSFICSFSCDHCIVCPSTNYNFLLPLWLLQMFLMRLMICCKQAS